MPPKPNLTRKQAGALATAFCPGCHARQRGLSHGVHCPEHEGATPPPPAPPVPGGAWNDDAQLVLGYSKVAESLGTLGCVHWVAHHGVNRPAAIGEAAGSTCVRAVTPPLGRYQRLEADERRVRDGPL